MVVRRRAAPPTPWSKDLAEPQIDPSAYVHSFSNIIGDVQVGANVLIAPGTSIRADEGFPFHIGDNTNIQDGVVIHGLEKGRVRGDDGQSYSAWVGKNTCITHMALIHGPVYIGDACFIGFRSTVFNARVGHGCIVMMHALIQDVEIPPGKYVPSGAVITHQQQADRLPDVQDEDRAFAHHVVEVNDALRLGYRCAEDPSCLVSIRNEVATNSGLPQTFSLNADHELVNTTMSLTPDTIDQVRSLLRQGFAIGLEHADKRRYRSKSWLTMPQLQGTTEHQVFAELENRLGEHGGEYVRLIGVDPNAKRRVVEVIIQRPDGAMPQQKHRVTVHTTGAANGAVATNGLSAEVVDQVRTLLRQGYRIGTEHADKRRYRSKSWLTCPQIQATQEQAVLAELSNCLQDHQGEYVRLIGVDANAKRRVLETIIQRPDDVPTPSHRATTTGARRNGQVTGASTPTANGGTIAEQIRTLLNQGLAVRAEHADKRRYRSKSWLTCSGIDGTSEAQLVGQIQQVLQEYPQDYVRLIGVDANAKRRIAETIIQRPGGSLVNGNGNGGVPLSNGVATASRATTAAPTRSYSRTASASLDPAVVSQVQSLLRQGYTIGTEHADKRRFRAKSWQPCTPIASTHEGEVFAALEACLTDHQGEYVRLLGIDAQAKRRVLEQIIQRP